MSVEVNGIAHIQMTVNNIEAALETADIPLRPGEAIIGAIGIALMVGVLITAFTRSLLTDFPRSRQACLSRTG